MGDSKEGSTVPRMHFNSPVPVKYLAFTFFILVLLFFFFGGFGLVNLLEREVMGEEVEANTMGVCGDGTSYNSCSNVKPYACVEGKLIEFASICGCPENFAEENNNCISGYETNSKELSLKYVLLGEESAINFTVYGGFADYVNEIPRSIYYTNGQNYSRVDFKLKAINEGEQKQFLLPLVVKIQNMTKDKKYQARIAISLVQNIPFGASNETIAFSGSQINHSRYPYEVLYDMKGICGEKTELLAFLLQEIGYGTSFFYYVNENHEAVGIKCPFKESLGETGYCFVETTAPSIITDDKVYYFGVGELYSVPENYILSDGIALGDDMYEYSDANKLIRIRNFIKRYGWLGPIREEIYNNLKEKYGLAENYYG
jgi:hypothetical protein